jgi:hypothetical protein
LQGRETLDSKSGKILDNPLGRLWIAGEENPGKHARKSLNIKFQKLWMSG